MTAMKQPREVGAPKSMLSPLNLIVRVQSSRQTDPMTCYHQITAQEARTMHNENLSAFKVPVNYHFVAKSSSAAEGARNPGSHFLQGKSDHRQTSPENISASGVSIA